MKDIVIDKVEKSRSEQAKDFAEMVRLRGGKPCPDCFDRGYVGWHIELEQYIACNCILNKAREIVQLRKEKLEVVN